MGGAATSGGGVEHAGDVHVVLASASPRRRELLGQLGVTFSVHPADIDESVHDREDPVAYVRRLSAEKATVVLDRLADELAVVIAADTTVDLDGRILGKPEDRDDAAAMLRDLSARTHRVHTGVTVAHRGERVTDVTTTLVTFTPVTDAALRWYLDSGEPFDKAGAYAIQGAGGVFVESVRGSVSNVVGFPLTSVVVLARRLGVELVG